MSYSISFHTPSQPSDRILLIAPKEIWLHIFSFLEEKSLTQTQFVNHLFHEIINSSELGYHEKIFSLLGHRFNHLQSEILKNALMQRVNYSTPFSQPVYGEEIGMHQSVREWKKPDMNNSCHELFKKINEMKKEISTYKSTPKSYIAFQCSAISVIVILILFQTKYLNEIFNG